MQIPRRKAYRKTPDKKRMNRSADWFANREMDSRSSALGYPAWTFSLNRIFCLHSLLFAFASTLGCEHIPQQLSGRDIELMSVTRISTAWIDMPDGSQLLLDSSQFDEMNALLKSLGPIESGESGELAIYNYQLNYHSGMDPTSIRVKIDDEILTFSLGDFVYVGGASDAFLKILTQLQNDPTGDAG